MAFAQEVPNAGQGGPGADYQIGPRDLVEIRVFEAEDLNATLRVSEDGVISMPLIGDIVVGGLTQADIEQALETALRQYMTQPQVNVFIREYRSQRVSVIGAVKRPGTIQMEGRMTLLEVLAEAGGVDYPEAAGTITILREGFTAAPIEVDMEELITQGNTAFNLELKAGDTVNVVPKPSYTIYVYGRVRNPGQFLVREDITLLQAIAMAGGLAERARSKVRIQRKLASGSVEQIEIDVNDIMDGKVADIPVLADDVIVVPETFF